MKIRRPPENPDTRNIVASISLADLDDADPESDQPESTIDA